LSAAASVADRPTVVEWSRSTLGRSAAATGLRSTMPSAARNVYQLDSADSLRATLDGAYARPVRGFVVASTARA
jgi:hypothetical protein